MKLDKQKKINTIMFIVFVLICIVAIILIPKNNKEQTTIKQEINQANQLIERGKQLKLQGQKMKKSSIHKVYKWAYGSGFLNPNNSK